MNPADYSALDEALEIMASNGPELNNGFSNHAPMAIEAMCAMGRRDSVMPWFERYRHWLAPRPSRVARLTDENWRGALGDVRRVEDWFEYVTAISGRSPTRSRSSTPLRRSSRHLTRSIPPVTRPHSFPT